MSDPVSNVEIEDVLSSIRRLVSSESRDANPVERAGGAPAPESAQKLVLTPSFRVDEAAVDAPPEEAETDDDAAESAEAGQDRDDADAPPEAHEPEREEDDDGDQAESADAETADAEMPERPADTLQARVAELEQVVARRADQWEPDGESDDDYAGGPVGPLPWEDYVPSDTGGDADGATETEAAMDTDAAPGAIETPDDSDETDAAASPAQEQADDDRTPDTFEEEMETPMPGAAETEDRLEEDFLSGDADEAILDEDALRELVTEIVRQELQGGLGERITRNVRKLVRREIHRALASQELE